MLRLISLSILAATLCRVVAADPGEAATSSPVSPESVFDAELEAGYPRILALSATAQNHTKSRRDSGGPGGSRTPGVSFAWSPSSDIAGYNAELEVLRQQLNIGGPVYRGERDTLILSFGLTHLELGSEIRLPDSGRPMPDDLWNVAFTGNWVRRFDNGWRSTLLLGLGSASDHPFSSSDEINVTVGTFLRIPTADEREAWLLSLMYLPASTLDFPVPGLAYEWNPSEQFSAKLGIPFSVRWQPRESLTLEGSYLPLTNVRARATWRPVEPVAFFAGYEMLQEAFFLADRTDHEERFMSFEQRLGGD
jgi:hypothetical protein